MNAVNTADLTRGDTQIFLPSPWDEAETLKHLRDLLGREIGASSITGHVGQDSVQLALQEGAGGQPGPRFQGCVRVCGGRLSLIGKIDPGVYAVSSRLWLWVALVGVIVFVSVLLLGPTFHDEVHPRVTSEDVMNVLFLFGLGAAMAVRGSMNARRGRADFHAFAGAIRNAMGSRPDRRAPLH